MKQLIKYLFLPLITLFINFESVGSLHMIGKKDLSKNRLEIDEEPIPITILTTNDLHAHVEGSGPDSYLNFDNPELDPVKGHYARITKRIHEIKEEKEKEGEAVVIVDSGDFLTGTQFSDLSVSERSQMSPALDFFKQNNYNVITLGNHEFDAYEDGLATALNKANDLDFNLNIVCSNLRVKKGSVLQKFLHNSKNNNNAQIYSNFSFKVKSKGKELVIGVIGAMGPDAALASQYSRSQTRFIGFDDHKLKKNMNALKRILKKNVIYLKKKFNPHLIILLYHGGNPEDVKLAEALPEVNLIVSGHTHKTYFVSKNGTLISQCGSNGEKIGKIELEIANGKVKTRKDFIHFEKINSSIFPKAEYLEMIETYKNQISNFEECEYGYSTPLGRFYKEYERKKSLSEPLGRMVVSGILKALNDELKYPADVYFGNIGAIRAGIPLINNSPTLFQFSDVYRMLALGYDKNRQPGSRIKGFYISPQNLKQFIEFSELVTSLHSEFKALFSNNLTYTINKNGIPQVNRIKNIKLNDISLEKYNRNIFFATNEILADYFQTLDKLTKGMMTIKMMTEDGRPLTVAPIISDTREHILFARYLQHAEVEYTESINIPNKFKHDHASDIKMEEECLPAHAYDQ